MENLDSTVLFFPNKIYFFFQILHDLLFHGLASYKYILNDHGIVKIHIFYRKILCNEYDKNDYSLKMLHEHDYPMEEFACF